MCITLISTVNNYSRVRFIAMWRRDNSSTKQLLSHFQSMLLLDKIMLSILNMPQSFLSIILKSIYNCQILVFCRPVQFGLHYLIFMIVALVFTVDSA